MRIFDTDQFHILREIPRLFITEFFIQRQAWLGIQV